MAYKIIQMCYGSWITVLVQLLYIISQGSIQTIYLQASKKIPMLQTKWGEIYIHKYQVFVVLFQFFKLILKHLLLTLQKMILFPSQIMIKITFISHWKCIYSLTVYAWCICTFREPITFFMGKIETL